MRGIQAFSDSMSRWLLIALASLLPIFFLPVGYVTTPQAKLYLVSALVASTAVFWFISSVATRTIRLPKHIIVATSLVLPLAYFISALLAGWPAAAIVSGIAEQDTVITAFLWFTTLFLAALVFSSQPTAIVPTVRAFVIGGAVVIFFQTVRLLFPTWTFGDVLLNETLTAAGSWHDLGIVLGLVSILSLILGQTRIATSAFWKVFFWATGVAGFLFLVVINMGDIWFVYAAALAATGLFFWFSKHAREGAKHPALIPILCGILALIACGLGWFGTTVHEMLPESLQVVAVEVRPSWEGTYTVSERSLGGSRELLFGSGPNSFSRNWALYKPSTVNTTLFWNLDFNTGVGVIPTSFVTIGALGVFAWGALILGFLVGVLGALRAARSFHGLPIFVFALACAIAYLLVFYIVYVPGIAISALLFLFLGLFVALPRSESGADVTLVRLGAQSSGQLLALLGTTMIFAVVLVASFVSLRALASDSLVNRSVLTYNRIGSIAEAGNHIRNSLLMWPWNDRAHRAAVELGILELAQLGQNASDPATSERLQQTLEATIQHGLAAVEIDRADYQNWLTLAQLYQELAGVGIEGAYEQAQAAYESARRENPTNPLPLFRLAQLESIRGDRKAALAHLDEAVKLKQDFAAAYFLQSQLYAQDGQLEKGITAGVSAAQLVPDDPLGWYNLGAILYLNSSFNDAAVAFAQAVNIRSDYSNALFMLALSLEKLGQREQAIAALTRVAEMNPTDQSIQTMITNLRAGQDPFTNLSN